MLSNGQDFYGQRLLKQSHASKHVSHHIIIIHMFHTIARGEKEDRKGK